MILSVLQLKYSLKKMIDAVLVYWQTNVPPFEVVIGKKMVLAITLLVGNLILFEIFISDLYFTVSSFL